MSERWSARFGRWAGAAADAGRFTAALFYWNWRKHRFRRGGCRGHAPCQNESDEARLGLVRCDAVMHWHRPARFRPLCPLLVSTPDGWRCSVRAADVRPFWGRALGVAGLAGLALWLALATGAFAFFRWGNELPVRWTDLAWPGHWLRVRTLQADRLFVRALVAFQQGRINEAYLALTSARQRDPRHYPANLLIGQITMFQGSHLFADEIFTRLRRDAPDLAYRTAVVYHDTLLMLLRHERLAAHSLAMAQEDPGHASLWVRSLLFAIRAGNLAPAFAREQTAALAALSPHARLLVEAEAEIGLGRPARAIELLRRPFSGPLNPVYLELQVARLAALGETAAAQTLLDFYGPLLGEFRHARAQFAVDRAAGDADASRATFRQLLGLVSDAERATLVALALIEQPDAELYADLHARFAADPVLRKAADGPTLWVAGLVSGAPREAAFWQANGRQPGDGVYPRIAAVNFASRDLTALDSVASVVNVVTFPREVVLALLTKLAPDTPATLPKRAPRPSRRP